MLTFDGFQVEFFESKAFTDRTTFNTAAQMLTAERWAATPAAMKQRQSRMWSRWEADRIVGTRQIENTVRALAAKEMSYKDAKRKADQWLEQWTVKAYLMGMEAAGVGDVVLGEADLEWLDEQWLAEESRFLHRFLREVDGELISPARARFRASMYGRSLDGAYFTALVSSFPISRGTRIRWVLGHAEHCSDCVKLSRKKYTPRSLPAVPRAGQTKCLSNCKCKLEVSYKPAAVRLTPTRLTTATGLWESDGQAVEVEAEAPLQQLLVRPAEGQF